MSTSPRINIALPSLELPGIRELATMKQWMLYRASDKAPLQPSGALAKTNDPETWSSFEEVA